MTYRITRHARLYIPKALKLVMEIEQTDLEPETKGIKRLLQKSIVIMPIPAMGVLTGVSVLEPTFGAIALTAGTAGYTAVMAGSAVTFITAAGLIFKDLSTGRRKYLPGKSKPIQKRKPVQEIEPYAEWDNVFLPYAVESFNGVEVKGSDGSSRNPIKLYTTPYVEFRTAPRTTGIDPSVMEAQKL